MLLSAGYLLVLLGACQALPPDPGQILSPALTSGQNYLLTCDILLPGTWTALREDKESIKVSERVKDK